MQKKFKAGARDAESTASLLFSVGRILREKVSRGKDPGLLIQIKALAMVSEQEHTTMKDIASCLHVASPTATSIIERMVDQGQLTRSPDPQDRRIVRLSITAKGRNALDQGKKAIDQSVDEILSSLGDAEKKKLNFLLGKIISTNQ